MPPQQANPEAEESKQPKKDGPSNTMWALLIGAAAALDLIQFLLDWGGIGLLLNPIIDVCVGGALPIAFKYFFGVSINWKKAIPWIAGPAWEIVTDGLLPIGWIIEIVATMILDKIERKVKNLPI